MPWSVRHLMGRVALGVLDVTEALAMREADVVGGDVVLEIDEALAASPDFPQRLHGEGGRLIFRQGKVGLARKAGDGAPPRAGGEAVAGGGRDARTNPGPLRRTARPEPARRGSGLQAQRSTPSWRPTWLARCDSRVPAARDAEEVGFDRRSVSGGPRDDGPRAPAPRRSLRLRSLSAHHGRPPPAQSPGRRSPSRARAPLPANCEPSHRRCRCW